MVKVMPWEKTTTGRLRPVVGAETRTSRSWPRSGAASLIGATETTGAVGSAVAGMMRCHSSGASLVGGIIAAS
ncbi:hypothetical protein GCM10023195_55730 [Actinoallomurus liliacearum]|uniref:Uncharacterized protein n=1 Tax=Actinoallomurus liliacearum TaxID=1080073 RepID=A0ABP8TP15_9ACTN